MSDLWCEGCRKGAPAVYQVTRKPNMAGFASWYCLECGVLSVERAIAAKMPIYSDWQVMAEYQRRKERRELVELKPQPSGAWISMENRRALAFRSAEATAKALGHVLRLSATSEHAECGCGDTGMVNWMPRGNRLPLTGSLFTFRCRGPVPPTPPAGSVPF